MNLSRNLPLSEMTKSRTAIRNGIDNTPTSSHLNHLLYWAKYLFQPLRDHFAVPVFVNSGYRSAALNAILPNASSTSFHAIGAAGDIDQDNRNSTITNAEIFWYIKNNLPFTELIWEHGDEKNPAWVHVALVKGREDEKEVLRAIRRHGKVDYIPFDL